MVIGSHCLIGPPVGVIGEDEIVQHIGLPNVGYDNILRLGGFNPGIKLLCLLVIAGSFPGEEAVLFLLRYQKSGRTDLKLLAPLCFYDQPGHYSPTVAGWHKENAYA